MHISFHSIWGSMCTGATGMMICNGIKIRFRSERYMKQAVEMPTRTIRVTGMARESSTRMGIGRGTGVRGGTRTVCGLLNKSAPKKEEAEEGLQGKQRLCSLTERGTFRRSRIYNRPNAYRPSRLACSGLGCCRSHCRSGRSRHLQRQPESGKTPAWYEESSVSVCSLPGKARWTWSVPC